VFEGNQDSLASSPALKNEWDLVVTFVEKNQTTVCRQLIPVKEPLRSLGHSLTMSQQPLIEASKEKIISLNAETQYAANGIVSRTVLNTSNGRIVLFGFDVGQELSEHTSTSHSFVQILSGECEFTLAGEPHTLQSGDVLYLPPNLSHAVKATHPFSMLLTLFKTGSLSLPTLEKASAKSGKVTRAFSLNMKSSFKKNGRRKL
jgi:quercetin dioxygenase-like cupin family protein